MNNAITSSADVYPCNCIGPQNGQPFCPCQMRSISVRDGRYVRDLGPVEKRSYREPETPEQRVERLRRELAEAEKAVGHD